MSINRAPCTYILISVEYLIYIGTRVLVQFLIVAKDNNRDIDRTKDGKLVRLLEQTTFALEKCPISHIASAETLESIRTGRRLHRTIPVIRDGLDFNLSSPHCGDAPCLRELFCSYEWIQPFGGCGVSV